MIRRDEAGSGIRDADDERREANSRRGGERAPLHVSLVAVPDVMVGTITGLYDVFRCFGALGWFDPVLASHPPFDVEIVAPGTGPLRTVAARSRPPSVITNLLVEPGGAEGD